MNALDWVVLCGTLGAIIGWGLWKEHAPKTSEAFLTGGRELRWWTIGLSIMATQASAITFLSMPGQAFDDGMGFLQFYFGQPIAMVLVAALILPRFYNLRVATAYAYLETRFDRKTRQLTALLFLLGRGLAAGVSILAPAIVLSAVLDWPLRTTAVAIGVLVVLYTVTGGTRIVSRTQTYQMVIMLGGMVAAAIFIWQRLPLSLDQTLRVAGAMGRMQIVDPALGLSQRYTLWSGLFGGLFVGLSYFGTDQSQVQRYLGGETIEQSRTGLMFNGLVKVPMQFLILLVGVLLFVYYQLNPSPLWFHRQAWPSTTEAQELEREWTEVSTAKQEAVRAFIDGRGGRDELRRQSAAADSLRSRARIVAGKAKDSDYIFIDFVVREFPHGLIGLLLAVILCASMSAVAAALSALGTTSVIDFYTPSVRPNAADSHYLRAGKAFTVGWGAVAVAFAVFGAQLDNLIQAVNILGSLFYGPMLGVFLVGFFFHRTGGTAVFIAALAAEALVIAAFAATDIGFLWYNVIGCGAVMALGPLLQLAPSLRRG